MNILKVVIQAKNFKGTYHSRRKPIYTIANCFQVKDVAPLFTPMFYVFKSS